MQQIPNLTYIEKLAGGDKAFEQKFLEILKKEFPIEVQAYQLYIEQNELIEAAEIVHKLKHKFNILSMTDAYKFAVRYEEALRVGKTEMEVDYLTYLETVRMYLKTI